ncbi:hypothetical protein PGTUg99_032862 [Puccinia graminis f. sp. tritici]|uniref:Uncharacterized protein n=1 Tax=Puccinia graminis f. sp. tritici TaxID=56615 RepID=A0A5B0N3L0_PUCGR|nr:hypothetical protein PGTUg99_032862 [Puccinia graminis f. sp. tritici]
MTKSKLLLSIPFSTILLKSVSCQSTILITSHNLNVVEDKTAKTGQVSSTESAQPSKEAKQSKTSVAKTLKSDKCKPISPAVVPSDWDGSTDAETKLDKPKAVVSTALPLDKTSTSSNPFEKQSIDKSRFLWRPHQPFILQFVVLESVPSQDKNLPQSQIRSSRPVENSETVYPNVRRPSPMLEMSTHQSRTGADKTAKPEQPSSKESPRSSKASKN